MPRTTLKERYNGGVSHVLSAETQQNLSNEQKNLLVQRIMDLDQAGHAPSFASVKAMTSVIRSGNSTDALPRKNWMTRSIKRHSSIKSKIGMKLERQRANSVTEEGILEWFHRLKTVIDKHSIKSDDMWNADEHGFALGIGSNGRVVGSSSPRTTVVKQPGNREFDDASDIKKQTFIKLYSKASYESLDSARIKNGWMAAGIQPWNPVKAAQTRFVLKTPSFVQIQPPTPPNRKRRLSETELITTPCISRQFRDLFRSAQNGGSSSRTRRLLFQKAYKGIDKISFQLQLEKEKNDSKDIQLEQLKREGHRGVIIDANQTFARLEQLHLVKEAEYTRDAAERARIAHFEANPSVASSVGSSLQDRCFEFSLDPSVR
ncbi:hypothetical protein K3495_g13247 [Podosphaera aphanis]|nr:hypothetical protein K3495_g13247 [Podosphaera aphanis]